MVFVYYKSCPECAGEKYVAEQLVAEKNLERGKIDELELQPPRDEALALSPLFPAPLRSWNRHCSRHQDHLAGDVAHVAAVRFIPVDWFDVFDAQGIHLCRACGAKLLTKNGRPHSQLRWCKEKTEEHLKLVKETFVSFNSKRNDYLQKLASLQVQTINRKHQDKIAAKQYVLHVEDAGSIQYYTWHGQMLISCEKCGDLCAAGNAMYTGISSAQVHHKLPVCHATTATVMSIFDENNFIALCTKCHGQSHPWRKRPAPPPEHVTTLDDFIDRA